VLSGPASFDELSCHSINGTDAHSSLSVSSESVLSSKGITAKTRIWLGPRMNLCMPLEIMASHESFIAVIALELSIIKVGLDVRFDVFLPAKSLIAIVEFANPLVVHRIWPFYVQCNVIQRDVCLLDGSTDAWFEVEV
jgi:hypothetical protein